MTTKDQRPKRFFVTYGYEEPKEKDFSTSHAAHEFASALKSNDAIGVRVSELVPAEMSRSIFTRYFVEITTRDYDKKFGQITITSSYDFWNLEAAEAFREALPNSVLYERIFDTDGRWNGRSKPLTQQD